MTSPLFSARASRRRFVGAASVLGAGLGLGGRVSHVFAQDATKATLALDWYPNANHAGLYLAQERGYFSEGGVNLELYVPADPTTVLQTVGAGRDTFGITYHADVLAARAEGVPVVSVAAFVQHPLNCLMVLADSTIQGPADLKGKSIAVVGVPSDDAVLKTMLGTAGLTLDDVEVVSVGYDLMPAVLSGRADAVLGVYWTHETILAEQQGTPVRFFKVQDYGVPDYYELVLVAGEETIANQGDLVTSVLGAIQRGFNDAITDQPAAIAALSVASPDLDVVTETEGLALLAPLWTDGGTVPFGTQTAERWEAYGGWLKEQGLLDGSVDVAAAWNGDLLGTDVIATPGASPVATPAG